MSERGGIIYLIGARASGKTTLGRPLADRLGMEFVDTDSHMRDACGMTVARVVEQEGWEGFRRRESAALREVSRPGRVVATGGGMVLAPENRDFMRANGTVLYLSAPAGVLAARLGAEPCAAQRPSLTGKSVLDEISDVLEQRAALYGATAHHVLDASLGLDRLVEAALSVCSFPAR